jgi:hypothetical protein
VEVAWKHISSEILERERRMQEKGLKEGEGMVAVKRVVIALRIDARSDNHIFLIFLWVD